VSAIAEVGPGSDRKRCGRRLRWDPDDGRFTVEEYKVARLVALGRTDREIGSELFISEWTVRYHLRKVFARFAIRRRLELVLFLGDGSCLDGNADDLPVHLRPSTYGERLRMRSSPTTPRGSGSTAGAVFPVEMPGCPSEDRLLTRAGKRSSPGADCSHRALGGEPPASCDADFNHVMISHGLDS
jgi:DNA-binding CsgD family transcriptional regulator